MILQVHYDNVDLDEGKIDSSGFKIYYTPTLRPYDAGVLEVCPLLFPSSPAIPACLLDLRL